MNEELQKALVDILNGVLSAKDFVLSELPDVVAQLLLWKFWFAFIQFGAWFLCMIVVVYLSVRLFKPVWQITTDTEPFIIIYGVAAIVIPVLLSAALFNITWLQIWLAPKVYLIEYAASLTK